jgi:hypothetical protein
MLPGPSLIIAAIGTGALSTTRAAAAMIDAAAVDADIDDDGDRHVLADTENGGVDIDIDGDDDDDALPAVCIIQRWPITSSSRARASTGTVSIDAINCAQSAFHPALAHVNAPTGGNRNGAVTRSYRG